jgi:retron-type reverse transcriptase
MATNKRHDTQQKILACLSVELGSIFATLDPFSSTFAENLDTRVNAQVADAWPNARACLTELPGGPRISEVNALRQVWAVATQSDLKLAVLYRSASLSSNPEIISTLTELATLSLSGLSDGVAICLIRAQLSGRLVPPSLSTYTKLRSGLRLRYGLANNYATTSTASSLLQVASTHSNASDFLRARELGRAVKALAQSGQPLVPITELEFYRLSKKAVRLAIGSEDLRKHLLPPIIQKTVRPELFANDSYDHKLQNLKQLEQLAHALKDFDVKSIADLTRTLTLDDETKRIAIDVLPVLNRQRKTIDSKERKIWSPLAPDAVEWFKDLPVRFRPPIWWSLSSDEVVKQIISKKITQSAVHPNELLALQRSWLKPVKFALYKAKCFWALESGVDLPSQVTLAEIRALSKKDKRFFDAFVKRLSKSKDPRPALEIIKKSNKKSVLKEVEFACESARLDWCSWILPAMGSTVWSNKFSYHYKYALKDIVLVGIEFLQSSGKVYEPKGFINLMHEGFAALNEDSRTDRIAKLVKILKTEPAFIKIILTHFPDEILERVLKHRGLPFTVIDFIDQAQPARILYLIWCLKLKCASNLAVLQTILAERFDQPELIPWHRRWLELEGTEVERRVALVLASRRSPKRLAVVAKHLGLEAFENGLKQAIATLPAKLGRERARLELVLALGVQAAPALAHVLALMKQDAASGHKLDHAYYRHELPKQSGGTRTISAPERLLKFTQRQILDRLLTPLGAHDCAYGFVKGRSIVDNAKPHINQLIVTNADVKNCFPSVKWPLVLGAMRRDLGKQFSPSAISYLVDICTAEGGMPIGAPTSPALLNRVLLKTDQILLEAALKRKCVYTRYADDLTFSGDKGAIELLGVAKRTLGQIGLALDPKKTNIFRRGRRQMVTGLVVNERVSFPRRLRRRLRAAVHQVQSGQVSQWHNLDQTSSALQGRLAFLQMVHPKEAMTLKKRMIEVAVTKPTKKKSKGADE